MDDIPLDGKRVIVRVDFNVSTQDGDRVQSNEDYRVQAALATIQELRRRRCKVLLLTHRGSYGDPERKMTLEPIRKHLEQLIKEDVMALPKLYGSQVESIVAGLEPGSVAMFPNVRSDEREMKPNEKFGKEIAQIGDAYINEAFSVCHRAQTSVVVLPQLLPSAAGRRTVVEVEVLAKLAQDPRRPYIAIASGAKIVTKIGMLRSLLHKVDTLCLGGQIANVFLEASGLWNGGYNANEIAAAKALLETAREKLLLPVDVVIGDENGTNAREVMIQDIPEGTKYLWDIGPQSAHAIVKACKTANTVMWNGPVGRVEVEAYSLGTKAIATALVDMKPYRVIGGGDTVNVLESLNITDKFDHVSVGGGAMVAVLEGSFMPGLGPLFVEEEDGKD